MVDLVSRDATLDDGALGPAVGERRSHDAARALLGVVGPDGSFELVSFAINEVVAPFGSD